MTRLLLVRHGENPANVHHILSCRRADFRLTALGRRQATEARAGLALGPRTRYWSSPLRRARHTAELVAPHGTPVAVLEDLRELDVGELDGSGRPADRHSFYDVVAAWRAGRDDTAFPGGENLFEATARLRRALCHVVATAGDHTAVVVGHGGLFTEGLHRLLEPADLEAFRTAHQPRWLNCEAAEFRARQLDGRLRLTWRAWHGWRRDSVRHPESAEAAPTTRTR
jgi:broad specificity phosphatase PhoE